MTVLDTLREFHAHDILSVRLDSLPRLTGLTQHKVDCEIIGLKRRGLLLVDRGYAVLAAPPSTARDDDEYTKQCTVCRKTKAAREFHEQVTNKDGLAGRCKACANARRNEMRKGRPTKDRARRICKCCGNRRDLERCFAVIGDNPFRRSMTCMDCERQTAAERHCQYCAAEFDSREGEKTCGTCRLELSMIHARREALCGVSP